jgi:hypothetical protein
MLIYTPNSPSHSWVVENKLDVEVAIKYGWICVAYTTLQIQCKMDAGAAPSQEPTGLRASQAEVR